MLICKDQVVGIHWYSELCQSHSSPNIDSSLKIVLGEDNIVHIDSELQQQIQSFTVITIVMDAKLLRILIPVQIW